MASTNSVGKVMVVEIRYPESNAWRLDANLTTHCKLVASAWKKTISKSLISIKLLRAGVSGPLQYIALEPLSLSLVLFITLQLITNKRNCCLRTQSVTFYINYTLIYILSMWSVPHREWIYNFYSLVHSCGSIML